MVLCNTVHLQKLNKTTRNLRISVNPVEILTYRGNDVNLSYVMTDSWPVFTCLFKLQRTVTLKGIQQSMLLRGLHVICNGHISMTCFVELGSDISSTPDVMVIPT
jgi:hypothetical protein